MSTAQPLVRLVHEVPAGNQFTGEAPDGIERNRGYTKHWTTESAAGLMDPDPDRTFPIVVKRVDLKLDGNTSAWSISIDDANISNADVVVLSGTDDENIVLNDPLILVPGQNIKILTAGATAALSASVTWDRSDID